MSQSDPSYDADFWQHKWQNQQIGFHQSDITPALKAHTLDIDDVVLVPLCGKSLDLLWLAERVNKVIGVELVEQAVLDFVAEHKLHATTRQSSHFSHYQIGNIEILVGDFFALEPADLPDFSLIFDRAAMVALPADRRAAYAKLLIELMHDEMLLVALDYPQAQNDGPPFAVSDAEIKNHFAGDCTIELIDKIDTKEDRWQMLSYFYESTYRICKKT